MKKGNKSKKFFSLAVITTLFVGSSASVVTAAEPKVGSTCTKVGAFYDTPNKRYVCNTEGKKKVWRVWHSSGKSAPASKPSTTPKKTNFKAPIPISLPAKQDGAITFVNALEKYADIPQVAWQNVQDTIAKNPDVNIPISFYVGPNTTLNTVGGESRIKEIVQRQAKLWSGFAKTTLYAIYAYNAQDEKITEQKFLSDFKSRGYNNSNPEFSAGPIRALAGNCQNTISPGKFSGEITNCRGANSGSYTGSSDSFLQLGQSEESGFFFTDGGIIGHEFLHAVQAAQWIGTPNCGSDCGRSNKSNQEFSPCWLFEGGPNSVGPMVSSRTIGDYLTYRKTLPYSQGPTTITDYTQPSLRNYLFNQSAPTCYQNGELYSQGYAVGAIATETLVAIAGPQAMMALFALGAEGQDFPTAFKNVYGISWSDASTILSKVLAAEYATFGSPPN